LGTYPWRGFWSGDGTLDASHQKRIAATVDGMASGEIAERIAKLETLLQDADKAALHSAAERQLKECRRALEPDF
jgi:hypothetical protein